MHTDVHDVLPALDILKSLWGGPIGVYAHSGKMIGTRWTLMTLSVRSFIVFCRKMDGMWYKIYRGLLRYQRDHIGLLLRLFTEQTKSLN